MVILNSEKKIDDFLDQESYELIMKMMENDAADFLKSTPETMSSNWIGKVSLFSGSDHEYSKIVHGFLLHYVCRNTKEGFEMGIIEIKIPLTALESHSVQVDLKAERKKQHGMNMCN
ncbi:MAG: hypothetical protein JEZ14_26180 [Marinilabiliaceae bacterium]|nr:hypothetical protein [Marinilabiliaceae bacterium]